MSAALLALALLVAPDSGWIAGPDGVRLYYQKIGNGTPTIIVPGRLFLARELAPLAERHTLILYDMRNRGRSSRVEDGRLLSIQKDVEDLEAVRRHFGVERFVPHRLLVSGTHGCALLHEAPGASGATHTARAGAPKI